MLLKDAKALRNEIRAEGPHCTVPLGQGPSGYFARIFHGFSDGVWKHTDFRSRGEWLNYRRGMRLRHAESLRLAEARAARTRTPIEVMIDRACGLS